MAATYHQLGSITHDRGRLEEAGEWYRQSLAIEEELDDRPGRARTYHQLGNTALIRGRLEEAGEWYRQSLAISEESGNRPYMAVTYAQLGLLAEVRGQAPQALAWNVRCVSQFDQVTSPLTATGPAALTRLTRQLGMAALEHIWQQVTRMALPQQIRDYITSQQPDESSQP
jgi:tetratricopeptide (TPR) repeat protein